MNPLNRKTKSKTQTKQTNPQLLPALQHLLKLKFLHLKINNVFIKLNSSSEENHYLALELNKVQVHYIH